MKRGTATVSPQELIDAVTSDHDTALEKLGSGGTGAGTAGAELGIRDSGFGIRDSDRRIRDSGLGLV